MLSHASREYRLLKKLDTPQKVQSYLESIPFNHERDGATCLSPLSVMREHRAHCAEGAFLACVAFMLAGRKPLIVSLKVEKPDDDHIIVVFKENGYYGALSKTNHAVLRYRDPVYRSVRELVMSYYHEYFLYKNGRKTLVGYTKPINMKRFGTKWITAEEDLWDIAEIIYDTPVIPIVPPKNKKRIRNATAFERRVHETSEWKK